MLSSHRDIESGAPELALVAQEPSASYASRLYPLLYLIPFMIALYDASQTGMGVKDEKKDFAYTSIALTFLASFIINNHFTLAGLKEVYESIRERKLPDDLKPLSKKKTAIAITTAAILTLYSGAIDAIEGYFYAGSIPEEYNFKFDNWSAVTWFMTAVIAFNSFSSQAFETFRGIHETLSRQKMTYANSASRIISPTLSVSLSIISAANNVLSDIVSTASVFKIKPSSTLYTLTAASSLSGYCSYILNQHFLREQIDELIKTLSKRNPTPIEMTSALIAMGVFGGSAMSAEMLAKELLDDGAKIFGTEPSPAVTTQFIVFSYLAATANAIVGTFLLFPPVNEMLNRAANAISDKLHVIYTNMAPERSHQADIAKFHEKFTDDHIPLLAEEPDNARPLTQSLGSLPDLRRSANDIPMRLFDRPKRLAPPLGFTQVEAVRHGYRLPR